MYYNFKVTLNYWSQVKDEVGKSTKTKKESVSLPASQFLRQNYPDFDPQSGDIVTKTISDWATNYLAPVGIELGVRVLRQALLYRDQLKDISQEEKIDDLTLNNIVRQKLLPRFSFDGKQSPRGRPEESCFCYQFNCLGRRLQNYLISSFLTVKMSLPTPWKELKKTTKFLIIGLNGFRTSNHTR